MTEFYDIVDSEGNVVETAQEQESNEVQIDHVNKRVIINPKKELTEGEIKKLRKQYVTVQNPKVAACGHSIDLNRFPHTNCQSCIFTWFNSHGEVVQQLDEMHSLGKDNEIIELQGIKFYKRWRQFMATVAQWQKVAEVNGNI